MLDIHNYKRRLERTLENIKGSGEISGGNKDVIIKFYDSCFSEGLSVCKTERYLYDLFRLAKMLQKGFYDADKEDLQKVMAEIEKKEWSPHSKQTFKIMMKKFYKWLEGNGEEYPNKIKWLKANLKNNHKKLPEELLTEEEVKSLIQFCENFRDRALISVLYESGCRIGEIGNMRIKDISFDEFGARMNVNGKTGPRIVRIVNSAPYLQEWINGHPYNQDSENYVWVKKTGDPLSYGRFSAIIKSVAKAAGIIKPVNPHNFRHARTSYLAQHITESQMKNYLGWQQSSKMAAVYVHIQQTDDAILKMNGLRKDEEKQEQILKPKMCTRCKIVNEVTNKFCKICGLPLNKEEADKIIRIETDRQKADEIMNKLIQDPEVLELIKNKLKNQNAL